jgi:TonB-dependent receptor
MTLLPRLSLAILVPLASAVGQGIIRGSVVDSATAEPLVGASVMLEGTAIGAPTDIEGRFRLSGVAPGAYSLKVSYLGYHPTSRSVTLGSDELTLIIRLSQALLEGEEVVVTGQLKGQIAAVNQQLASNTIVNVVSEERIQELPDVNAAEVIGRLPGVSLLRSGGEASKVILRGMSDKFSTITIDGVKIPPTDAEARGVDMSMISQGSLAGVELFKALTSDMDADAIAGSVNLVTKKAPAERLLRLDLKGNYHHLTNGLAHYDVTVRYGERFFDDLFGVQISGNLERRTRSSERYDLDYDQSVSGSTSYFINDFTLEYTDEIRKRSGAGLFLDVTTPDGGSVRLNNVYSRTDRDYLTSSRNYPVTDDVYYSFRDREQKISTLNSSLQGESFLGPLLVTWGASYGQSLSEFPYDYYMDFRESSNAAPDGTPISGMGYTPLIKDRPELLIAAALNSFESAILYSATYRTEESADRERTAHLNFQTSYQMLNDLAGVFKVGGKYRSKLRGRDRGELYSPYYLGYWQDHQFAADGSVQVKDLRGTRFEPFYLRFLAAPTSRFITAAEFLDSPAGHRDLFDAYRIAPLINRDALRQWYALNRNGVDLSGIREYHDNPAIDADFYGVHERVTAAYAMNTLHWGTLATLVAGVRVERELNDYDSRWSPVSIGGFPVPMGITKDTSATYAETVVLPNVQLTLRPVDFALIRLSAYRALARPDFNLRLEKFISWTGFSNAKRLILGNPKLRTAKAWNYEVNTSLFGPGIGLISISGFYKEIADMFHVLSGASTTGNALLDEFGISWRTIHSGDYALTVPYNSKQPTQVWGMEFEHQMNFSFMPGFLQHVVLNYNFSITRSRTHLLSTTIDTSYYFLPEFPGIPFPLYKSVTIDNTQKLEGQPEFFGNIALGYDIGGFSARLSVYHQAGYNDAFSASGRSDLVVNRFTRLDLSVKQELAPGISLLLNLNNLTDIREGSSITNRVIGYTIPNIAERYGTTADLGVKVEL